MEATKADFHLHDTYWTKPEALSIEDVADFHRLSVSVNWPHRPQDIEMVLGLGQGFVARDTIHRPIGTGMWFEYGQSTAMIGMMMTHPKLQAGGLGKEILTAIEHQVAGRHLRLNATKPAYQLYRNAGFRDCATVVQYQGTVHVDQAAVPAVRMAETSDIPAITALDRTVFGALRDTVLMQLFEQSQAVVLEDAGEITGFAMCRSFGRGHLVGPLISGSEADAIALFTALARPHNGTFMRLDADQRHVGLGNFLNTAGLENYDKITAMTKGDPFGPEGAKDHVYALASQALG